MHSERKGQHSSQPRGIPRDKILLFIGVILIAAAFGWLLFKTPPPKSNPIEPEPIEVDTPLISQDTSAKVVKPPTPAPKNQTPTPLTPDSTIAAEVKPKPQPKKSTLRKPTIVDIGNGWKKYKGSWFEVEFPEMLSPITSLDPSSNDIESVFFQSIDKELEFYIAVSPKKKTPKEFVFDNKVDSLEIREIYADGNWTRCFNRNMGTIRIYREFHRSNCRWFIGCRSHDSADYERMKLAHERFKKSFVKFGF